MNTAIDFKALMKAERKRILEQDTVKNDQYDQKYDSKGMSEDVKHIFDPQVISLTEFTISNGNVSGIFYIPNFILEEEASKLIDQTCNGERKWRNLCNRRLQIHGGIPHPSGMYQGELPSFLGELCDLMVKSAVISSNERPNHVLLNEYTQGQGIRPHKDGPMYEPQVCILSLGSTARLDFWASQEEALNPENSTPRASVMLEHCSLLVFTGEAYEDHWHGILANRNAPSDYKRISYTLRKVKNVIDADRIIYTAEQLAEQERREKQFEDSINDAAF